MYFIYYIDNQLNIWILSDSFDNNNRDSLRLDKIWLCVVVIKFDEFVLCSEPFLFYKYWKVLDLQDFKHFIRFNNEKGSY